jgi:NADPH2:quinone reductase
MSLNKKTSATMDAIVLLKFGGPEVLEIQQVPKPEAVSQDVLIKVKAFGLNPAESHIRKGEWDVHNPIMGLECAGIVQACPGGEIPIGSKVIAIMGGIGLLRPGSYGEYVTVPIDNVVKIETGLSWKQLAAIPLVYACAYSSLFTMLDIHKDESLLIRGATSTIGQAAVHLAVDAGIKVTATTRRKDRFDVIKKMGAINVILESDDIDKELPKDAKFDKILNLIGNRVLVKSINLTRSGGRMLLAGWLGGLEPVTDFQPMLQISAGVYFALFNSRLLGTPELPLSAIPFQSIVKRIEKGAWDANPVKIFDYKDIQKAHEMLDSSNAGGKIVVER